jgi:V8-like Glu-specific endopeptidase
VPPPVGNVDFGEPPEETGLEKIIGTNNLKSIAWLRRGLDVARSVCRVVTPFTIGSGFIVSGGRLVTNHHVIPTAAIAAKSYVEFNVEEDLAGQLAVPHRVAIDASSVNAKPDLDYCVAALTPSADGVPLSTWGELEIEIDAIPAIGEHVTIIQHPAGGPKQIAVTANQVVNIYEHRLQYSTDTMPGSSGSPVFNDNWKVVALHHKGGNIVANASGAKMFANEGILMRDLRAHQVL